MSMKHSEDTDGSEGSRVRRLMASDVAAVLMLGVMVLSVVSLGFAAGYADTAKAAPTTIGDNFEDGTKQGWSGGTIKNVGYASEEYSLNVQGNTEATKPVAVDMNDFRMDGVVRTNGSAFGGFTGLANTSVDEKRIVLENPSNPPNNRVWELQVYNGSAVTSVEFGSTVPEDEWQRFAIRSNGTHIQAKGWAAGSGEPDEWNATIRVDSFDYTSDVVRMDGPSSGTDYSLDWYEIRRSSDPLETLSGTVTNEDNEKVSGVEINVSQSGTQVTNTTTDVLGDYSVGLSDGTYNVTASKTGYVSETKTVTVSGSDKVLDFELTKSNETIRINTRNYVKHGLTVPFEVLWLNGTSGEWEDVTLDPGLSVDVNNTSVVTVSGASMTATNDTSVNDVTTINATYNNVSANHEVVVANQTIENIDILPPMQKWTATIGDDNTLVILVATAVAAGVALYATSLAGLGAFALVIIGGWLGGFTADHTVISALLVTLFVGLNVSQLVEFDRR